MTTNRTILVGDVHGCLEELDELLRTVEYSRSIDRLILLGDLLDKGPDPVGVVRRAQEIGAQAVLGNHDEKHLRWRRHEEKVLGHHGFYVNPMKRLSPERLAQNAALSDADIAWLRALPLTLALEGPGIAVHGGFEPGLPMEKQHPDKLLRCRYVNADGRMVPISNDLDQPPGTRRWAVAWHVYLHAFYGHHCLQLGEVQIDRFVASDGNAWLRCGLDAGAAYGGNLAAMIVTSRGLAQPDPTYEIVKVRAKAAYARPWLGDDA